MKSDEILDDATEITNWNEDSKINILCEFIDSHGPKLTESLKRFIAERVEEEKENNQVTYRRDCKNGLYHGLEDDCN